MSTFTFLHAADLHLDSPMRGLIYQQDTPAEVIKQATRRALENLVHCALTERVAFVILAGDLYDGPWEDFNTPLFLNRQMLQLRDGGIPVYVVKGNHDAENRMTRSLRLPDNVRYFPTDQPGTFVDDHLGVALHGQSYRTAKETADLSQSYPAPVPHLFNIGILHTCAEGREGHERYAPCRVADLAAKGYQYWALGHVHQREVLQTEPYILFPGNVQGRHIRETGPKGATLVTYQGTSILRVEPVDLDVVRWARVQVDASPLQHVDDVLEAVDLALADEMDQANGRLLAARVELTGISPAHDALAANWENWPVEVVNLAQARGGDALWIEKVELLTRPPSASAGGETAAALATLNEVLAECSQNPSDLLPLFDDLRKKLAPHKLDARLWSAEHLRRLLDTVGPLLRHRLQPQPQSRS
jgi:predicted phosphodiesterase